MTLVDVHHGELGVSGATWYRRRAETVAAPMSIATTLSALRR